MSISLVTSKVRLRHRQTDRQITTGREGVQLIGAARLDAIIDVIPHASLLFFSQQHFLFCSRLPRNAQSIYLNLSDQLVCGIASWVDRSTTLLDAIRHGTARHGRESLHRGRAAQGGGVLRAARPDDRLGRDTRRSHLGRGAKAHLHAGVGQRGKYHDTRV